jgi:hypothetical protein
MATKSKKKVKNPPKQKQKQTQKQNVVVNVNTTVKKTTKKKRQSNKSPEQTNRPLRPTAETAYNRVITQSQPMLIQQIPNNNDLIGAIQQIANKFQQPTVPVQYNPELYENTLKGLNELNETLKKKPTEILKTSVREKPEKRGSDASVYNIDLTTPTRVKDDGAGVFSMIPYTTFQNKEEFPETPKKKEVADKPSIFTRAMNTTKKTLGFSPAGAKTNKEETIPLLEQPQQYKTVNNKTKVYNPLTKRWIDVFGTRANSLGIGVNKPPAKDYL